MKPALFLSTILLVLGLTSVSALASVYTTESAHTSGERQGGAQIVDSGSNSARIDEEPSILTIHTENFAVVRDKIHMNIPPGGGSFFYDKATLDLEPTSVVLLPDQGGDVSIAEQSYRNDVLSTPYLLSLFEGKAIDFVHEGPGGERTVFSGRVVRSGYNGGRGGNGTEPIIQMHGKMRFGLPGIPLFPDLGNETLLKPRLEWKVKSASGFQGSATVSYLTGGMGWDASYNLVIPSGGGRGDLSGLVSVRNQTGRDFSQSKVKLLAGEVRREIAIPQFDYARMEKAPAMMAGADGEVERKSFDEYHVYSLPGTIRLRNQETKQVEFLSSRQVMVDTVYRLTIPGAAGLDSGEGVKGKVEVVRRFSNTEDNGLGVPMPAGIVRVYKIDGKTPEFLGESSIGHTPEKEVVDIVTGTAFDITAKKHRTNRVDKGRNFTGERMVSESYSITISNRKKEPISINVIEPLLTSNWEISQETHPHRKTGAGEVQWDIQIPADESVTLAYEVLYKYP